MLNKGPYFNYVRTDRGRECEHESVWSRTGREGGSEAYAYTVAYAMESYYNFKVQHTIKVLRD